MSDAGDVDDPGELQLDVIAAEVLEETAAVAAEHRNQVDQLVEDAGSESELRRPGAVHQHVLVARSLLGAGPLLPLPPP